MPKEPTSPCASPPDCLPQSQLDWSRRTLMQTINRRDFGRLALRGAGALAVARDVLAQDQPPLPPIKSTLNDVVVGCNTYSLSSLPLDDAIKAIADIGFGISELHPYHVEPPFGLRGAGPGPLTPEQVKGREKLRQ